MDVQNRQAGPRHWKMLHATVLKDVTATDLRTVSGGVPSPNWAAVALPVVVLCLAGTGVLLSSSSPDAESTT
jgi:hypothetical protein